MILVRRWLPAYLAVALVLSVSATSASAARAAPTGIVHVRDIGGPITSGERDAGVAGPPAEQATPAPVSRTPSAPADIQRQGSVVAVFMDPADPLIVLAVESGYLTVRLRCGNLCPSIHLGDYVVAEGRRRSEAVLDAVEVWVVTP
ncbi:MAG: hypothetical protein AB7P40_14510 [Chloroflexota bacterium]